MTIIKGFSKLSREEKIAYIKASTGLNNNLEKTLEQYRHPEKQALFDEISENAITNYLLPFGVAPNFLINGRNYIVPMVIEESSVVAAAARAASFWAQNGGFKVIINDNEKIGHIWFSWKGNASFLLSLQNQLSDHLKGSVAHLTRSMEQRGGGITGMELIPLPELENIWQLHVKFNTADSMGANFINSCLEEMKNPLLEFFYHHNLEMPDILMAILSNYTPNCLVTCQVECRINQLQPYSVGLSPSEFAYRFKTAVDIAHNNVHRAATHNKGIFNGIDAVIIATGNDFRAVEAAGHAYASRSGQYRSLSSCHLSDDGFFRFSLTVPLSIGTVGGLTKLHPVSNLAIQILNNPSAKELMGIAAAAGLANNFSAVASLVTTGIQKGHMKLHLTNILNTLEASDLEKPILQDYFKDKTISYKAVADYLSALRKKEGLQ